MYLPCYQYENPLGISILRIICLDPNNKNVLVFIHIYVV